MYRAVVGLTVKKQETWRWCWRICEWQLLSNHQNIWKRKWMPDGQICCIEIGAHSV